MVDRKCGLDTTKDCKDCGGQFGADRLRELREREKDLQIDTEVDTDSKRKTIADIGRRKRMVNEWLRNGRCRVATGHIADLLKTLEKPQV